MKHLICLFPCIVLALCPVWALAADKPSKAPELPELPEALRRLETSKGNEAGKSAARLQMKDGLLLLSLSASKPLTDTEWDAVAALHPKAFAFNNQALSDEGMDRLVALDPVSVTLRITPLTGAGVAKFGLMKNLRSLMTFHMHQATAEAKEALGSHPSLEELETAGDFCIEALSAPNLKSVGLSHLAVTVARIQELGKKPSVESLSLSGRNVTTLNNGCLAAVAKIHSLQTLKLSFAVLTYDGGLKQLEGLPNLRSLSLSQVDISAADLDKFKTALPSVKVSLIPMTAEYRKTWDAMMAKEAAPARR